MAVGLRIPIRLVSTMERPRPTPQRKEERLWLKSLFLAPTDDTLWMASFYHFCLILYWFENDFTISSSIPIIMIFSECSICICLCIPPFLLVFVFLHAIIFFSTSLLRQRSNFIYERALISRRADSQLNLEMASQCQCFRFADVWLCRFDLLRFYFIARSWFIRLNFFQPSRYINQGPIIDWNKFSEVGKQRNNRGGFIYVSRFSYWKLFWAVEGILPGLMICLPAMLANSPFLNLVNSSPPNLVNASLSKMVNLFVKSTQIICQVICQVIC